MNSPTKADTRALGFIGLGLMGMPMCRRLLNAGRQLHIWNRSQDKYAALPSATAADSPASVAQRATAIMLCLANDAAVRDVCLGERGIFSTSLAGKICIDFSSTSPDLTRALAQRCEQLGGQWIDAPVSGGVRGAETGSLIVMCGGDERAINAVADIFHVIGQRHTRLGNSGAGQIGKICNQLIVASNAVLLAEMVNLAKKSGIDAGMLPEALAGGFADSLPFQILAPRMAANISQPVQWKVETLLKDLHNTLNLAQAQHCNTPMSSLAASLMAQHRDRGHATDDLSTLIQLYEHE